MGLQIEKLNGKRELLADKLPLKVPFSISVTTANVCNLKCEYCSVSDKNHPKNKPFLELDTFKKLIDSMVECEWHLKQIVLVGLGEPFLNKNLVDFVKYAKEKGVADKIHIVTNGTMMSPAVIDQLIECELDVLRVSINGLSSEDYEKYTGVSVDFSSVVSSIEYFYKHKTSTKIYVKIMDYMVETDEKKQAFYDTFNPICDVANIEFLTQMSTTMDYESVATIDSKKGLKGFEAESAFACPLPFYHIYFNAEGTISACCIAGPWSTPPALQMGSIFEYSIDEIWNSEAFYNFKCRMLTEGLKKADKACRECKAYMSYIYPEDNIDNHLNEILDRMRK